MIDQTRQEQALRAIDAVTSERVIQALVLMLVVLIAYGSWMHIDALWPLVMASPIMLAMALVALGMLTMILWVREGTRRLEARALAREQELTATIRELTDHVRERDLVIARLSERERERDAQLEEMRRQIAAAETLHQRMMRHMVSQGVALPSNF